jgi:group I intron endonuclease
MKTMGIIYCARNKVNGKRYIGQTERSLSKRKRKHESDARLSGFSFFWEALREFGFDNFEWSVIFEDVAEIEADKLERETISVYKTQHPNGYNMQSGGITGFGVIDETRAKLSKSGRSRPPMTEETKKRMGVVHKGRKRSDETRKKISAAVKGKPKSDEHRQKLSEARKNISDETRLRMSIAAKNKPPVSDETRQKLSAAGKRKFGKSDQNL